ncbi:transcriptional coactivator p15/PC4 family protein [Laribacter hongkongensis]|uniref:transcriptional coactivator p15/PC4 family protein n=1 Tax=Laribacter hongkongensis TaxID=168471 RepID=UPI001EFD3C1F|nr:transcriptional coactivator p15/PC4 family protein [Laribacter hongkongensis]MCG9033145.1 transcriptional coactivator p15/PC4 family protein [Laribacter hongkongensis]MCG9093184.1 transcriptional coactivator p15/PC4 family protein [Laribacter hongkongensis]
MSIVHTIDKSDLDCIRIERKTFRGHDYIDLRQHTDLGDGEGFRPTKKGITLPPDRLPELIEALLELQHEQERG